MLSRNELVEDYRWRTDMAGHNSISLIFGILFGYTLFQQAWMVRQIKRDMRRSLSLHQNRGSPGMRLIDRHKTEYFTFEHTIEDGIERVVYRPVERRHSTPILMQHGMWHGAWCWKSWLELFAEWGWESHAYSLPGHAGSALQRPIERCTLHYYLGFLKEEVQRFEKKPVFIGHSMGAGLGQWWLKHVSDDLPAMVWIASWDSHSVLRNMVYRFIKRDPFLIPMVLRNWNASPLVRTPKLAYDILLSPTAEINADEFHSKLSPESVLPVYQHSLPFWTPPEKVNTPILWIAAKHDFTISTAKAQKSARVYGADYCEVDGGHDLFFEPNRRSTAEKINAWLGEKVS